MLNVPIQRLPHGVGLPLPAYQTAAAAGLDLCAAVPDDAPLVIAPGAVGFVPTGFALAIPVGFEGQVRPRSGLSTAHRLLLPNAPGTIDADYRGELKVALLNLGDTAFTVTRGRRIAQLVIAPVPRVAWSETDTLPPTARGAGGFGHTDG